MVAQTPLLSEQIVRMSRARRWLQHPQGEPPWGIAQARSRPDFGDVSSGLPEKARTPKSFKYLKEINEFCLSGPSGTPLGALLGPLGGLLARLWTILGTSWAILGPSGPSWGALRGLLRPRRGGGKEEESEEEGEKRTFEAVGDFRNRLGGDSGLSQPP